MKLYCMTCDKAVSTEVPNDTVVRAVIECIECFEAEYDDLMVECAIDDALMATGDD